MKSGLGITYIIYYFYRGSHLTKELDDNHLDSASIDGGDALRAYEKRLTKLSQKDRK